MAFDDALRNLGQKASMQQREYHGVMRNINGNAALRGFARDQRYSLDPEMRTQAREALKVAGDEGRLILDEQGAVVGAEGKAVHVEKGAPRMPACMPECMPACMPECMPECMPPCVVI